jgi:hypothetical protein
LHAHEGCYAHQNHQEFFEEGTHTRFVRCYLDKLYTIIPQRI